MEIHPAIKQHQRLSRNVGTLKLQGIIEEMFKAYGKALAKEQMAIYVDKLSGYDADIVAEAIDELMNIKTFLPSLADLFAAIRPKVKSTQPEDTHWQKQLEKENNREKLVLNKALEKLGTKENIGEYVDAWLSAKMPWMKNHAFKRQYIKCALFDLEDSDWDIARALSSE
jgi:hypothetical protein